MNVDGKSVQTLWLDPSNPAVVKLIDQRHLPHRLVIEQIRSLQEMAAAIRDMHVRGAPLIGAAAAYGLYLAALEAQGSVDWHRQIMVGGETLKQTRPTAVNLAWAVERQIDTLREAQTQQDAVEQLRKGAEEIREAELLRSRKIGEYGVALIEQCRRKHPDRPVQIMTHCNAGWLACIDYGTATAPMYEAFERQIPVHIWVSETRPRNQGASLTAWELGQHGVPHTLIADNEAGHLLQQGLVDLVITGADRTARNGDSANKIGTYLKALAANDNGVPFYIAIPSSTIDMHISDGVKEIPIEERAEDEVRIVSGLHQGSIIPVLICPETTRAANFGFDVTPARLITGLITERGICAASESGILSLFPEFAL